MRYLVKTPALLRWIYPRQMIWRMRKTGKPAIYITFDDGPHPDTTPFVLDQLRLHNARATFFCVGENVGRYPDLYRQILSEGHTVGNHTYNHLDGWKTDDEAYLANIDRAGTLISSNLFRPPYGKIKRSQLAAMIRSNPDWKLIMWEVLSADFDRQLSGDACLKNVERHTAPGSIVLFHDSVKAWPRMSFALPRFLDFCRERGWLLPAI